MKREGRLEPGIEKRGMKRGGEGKGRSKEVWQKTLER
jgi:hypothetical protein